MTFEWARKIPYFCTVQSTPVQPLTAAVIEMLELTFHSGFTPWTLLEFSTQPKRVYNLYTSRPTVSRGEQKLI